MSVFIRAIFISVFFICSITNGYSLDTFITPQVKINQPEMDIDFEHNQDLKSAQDNLNENNRKETEFLERQIDLFLGQGTSYVRKQVNKGFKLPIPLDDFNEPEKLLKHILRANNSYPNITIVNAKNNEVIYQGNQEALIQKVRDDIKNLRVSLENSSCCKGPACNTSKALESCMPFEDSVASLDFEEAFQGGKGQNHDLYEVMSSMILSTNAQNLEIPLFESSKLCEKCMVQSLKASGNKIDPQQIKRVTEKIEVLRVINENQALLLKSGIMSNYLNSIKNLDDYESKLNSFSTNVSSELIEQSMLCSSGVILGEKIKEIKENNLKCFKRLEILNLLKDGLVNRSKNEKLKRIKENGNDLKCDPPQAFSPVLNSDSFLAKPVQQILSFSESTKPFIGGKHCFSEKEENRNEEARSRILDSLVINYDEISGRICSGDQRESFGLNENIDFIMGLLAQGQSIGLNEKIRLFEKNPSLAFIFASGKTLCQLMESAENDANKNLTEDNQDFEGVLRKSFEKEISSLYEKQVNDPILSGVKLRGLLCSTQEIDSFLDQVCEIDENTKPSVKDYLNFKELVEKVNLVSDKDDNKKFILDYDEKLEAALLGCQYSDFISDTKNFGAGETATIESFIAASPSGSNDKGGGLGSRVSKMNRAFTTARNSVEFGNALKKENIMMKNDSSFTENNYPVNEVASTLVPEGSRANSFNENPTVDDFSRSMEAVNQVFDQDRNLQSKLNEISGSLAGKLPPSENAGQLVKDYIAGKSNLSSRDFLCDSALSSQQCEKENTDVMKDLNELKKGVKSEVAENAKSELSENEKEIAKLKEKLKKYESGDDRNSSKKTKSNTIISSSSGSDVIKPTKNLSSRTSRSPASIPSSSSSHNAVVTDGRIDKGLIPESFRRNPDKYANEIGIKVDQSGLYLSIGENGNLTSDALINIKDFHVGADGKIDLIYIDGVDGLTKPIPVSGLTSEQYNQLKTYIDSMGLEPLTNADVAKNIKREIASLEENQEVLQDIIDRAKYTELIKAAARESNPTSE